MVRRNLLALLIIIPLAATCLASSDETAMGAYSYSSKSLRVRLLFDLDGVKNVVINGKLYRGTFPVSESGRHDGIEAYSFSVQDKAVLRNIQLFILFDVDDAVRAVVGIYSERSQSSTAGGASHLMNVHVFQPTFRRINLEEPPSAKQADIRR